MNKIHETFFIWTEKLNIYSQREREDFRITIDLNFDAESHAEVSPFNLTDTEIEVVITHFAAHKDTEECLRSQKFCV